MISLIERGESSPTAVVLEGAIDITVGDARRQLREGACLAMRWTGPPCSATRRESRRAMRW